MSELVQGSTEWHAWRKKGIGSSEIASIMGLNPYTTREHVFKIKTGQIEPEDISQKYAVKRGNDLEPYARDLFNNLSGLNYVPKTFVDTTYKQLKYSSDGWDEATGDIIEVKCMGDRNHCKVLDTKKVLDYYIPQCQWGLMISYARVCWFISYRPEHEVPITAIEVKPDVAFIKEMRAEALKFWSEVEDYLALSKENSGDVTGSTTYGRDSSTSV